MIVDIFRRIDPVEAVASLIECAITTDFIIRFLTAKNKKAGVWFYALCVFLLFIDVSIQNYISVFEGFSGLTQIIACFGLALVFLKGKASEKLFVSVLSCIPIILINLSVLTVVSRAFSIPLEEVALSKGAIRLITLFSTKFLYFLVTRYIVGLKQKENYALSSTEWITVIIIFATTLVIGVSHLSIVFSENEKTDTVSFGVIGGLVVINILTYTVLLKISRENKRKTRYAMMEIQLGEQEKSMREIKSSYSEIIKIRHDLKNYIECGTLLLKDGHLEEALSYFERISYDKIGTVVQFVNTSSNVINAVINSKLTKCREEGIEFKYLVTASIDAFDEIELGILISNLFDNAIEALSKSKGEKNISLDITDNKGYLCILMKNSLDVSVLEKNPKLLTSKIDKKRHGIGLKSVRDIVDKHEGLLNFSEEYEEFIVDLWLKFPDSLPLTQNNDQICQTPCN